MIYKYIMFLILCLQLYIVSERDILKGDSKKNFVRLCRACMLFSSIFQDEFPQSCGERPQVKVERMMQKGGNGLACGQLGSRRTSYAFVNSLWDFSVP